MKVIRFHSVGLRKLAWRSPQIAEDIGPFRDKLLALRRAGYQTYFFSDPRVHAESPPADGVCLTFDDGYLDNWVHVFPVLEELGMKATIFVTTDFIDPRDVKRPLVRPQDVPDAEHDAANCCAGFLSWPEMREMVDSGLVEIQSHAKTHTRHFTSDRIVDYWRPGSMVRPAGPSWMVWNQVVADKPFYLSHPDELERVLPWGVPVYEHAKTLTVRCWIPSEDELQRELVDHVQANGAGDYFERADWRAGLDAIVARDRRAQPEPSNRGRFETDEERLARVDEELREPKRILETGLGREVDCLAWPGDGVDTWLFDRARAVGYRRFTRPEGMEGPGIPARISSAPRIYWKNRDLGHPSGREFVWTLRRMDGDLKATLALRFARLARLVVRPFGAFR